MKNKVGRPRLPIGTAKTKLVGFMVTTSQATAMSKECNRLRMKMSDFIRMKFKDYIIEQSKALAFFKDHPNMETYTVREMVFGSFDGVEHVWGMKNGKLSHSSIRRTFDPIKDLHLTVFPK